MPFYDCKIFFKNKKGKEMQFHGRKGKQNKNIKKIKTKIFFLLFLHIKKYIINGS